jgi:hypothetical protein
VTGHLNGAVATGLYNAANVFLLAHAFTGWQPLLTAADRLGAVADRFQAAQLRTDKTLAAAFDALRTDLDAEPYIKDQP